MYVIYNMFLYAQRFFVNCARKLSQHENIAFENVYYMKYRQFEIFVLKNNQRKIPNEKHSLSE